MNAASRKRRARTRRKKRWRQRRKVRELYAEAAAVIDEALA